MSHFTYTDEYIETFGTKEQKEELKLRKESIHDMLEWFNKNTISMKDYGKELMMDKVKCSCGARDKEKCHKESSSGYGKMCCKATKSS